MQHRSSQTSDASPEERHVLDLKAYTRVPLNPFGPCAQRPHAHKFVYRILFQLFIPYIQK